MQPCIAYDAGVAHVSSADLKVRNGERASESLGKIGSFSRRKGKARKVRMCLRADYSANDDIFPEILD